MTDATPSMMTLAATIHSAESSSDGELLTLSNQQQQAAQDVRTITVQQGSAAISKIVGQAVPALQKEAQRVTASKPKQADALTLAANLLSAVAQTGQKIAAEVASGKSVLEACLDVALVSVAGVEKQLPKLTTALQITKQLVTFSKNPDLYGAASLVNLCAAQLGKFTKTPLANLASQIILPIVSQALTLQGDVQRGRQKAFDTGVSALARSAQSRANAYRIAAKNAQRTTDQGAYIVAAAVMDSLAKACSNMQSAVTGGRELNDVLSDVSLCPPLPAGFKFAPAGVALAFASQPDDSAEASRLVLERMKAVGSSAVFERDVSLVVIVEAVKKNDKSTSKYLTGALVMAQKILAAKRVQNAEVANAGA